MAANERSQSSCLGLLQQQGKEFNFFQAIRLLEKVTVADQKIRFRAVNSEAFHSNFIAGIEQENSNLGSHIKATNRITVSVNAFGLTGQQGPIPECYSEMIRRATVAGKNGAEDPQAFLDIFSDKQIGLLYEIKKHFNPMLFNEIPTESSLYTLLSSISGFNTLNLFDRLPIERDQLAAFAPVMANRRTDYSLIRNVLKNFFGCNVTIIPNQGAWRALPRRYQAQLTINSRPINSQSSSRAELGKGMGLGRKYWDNQAAITLLINVPSIEKCLAMLPGGQEHQTLSALITFLTDGKYFIYVTLKINWKDIPKSQLNSECKLRLGQTSWLKNQPDSDPEINYPDFIIMPSLKHDFSRPDDFEKEAKTQ